MLDPLAVRTVLVTGGTSGIGLATARALATQGVNLVVLGRDPEKVKRVRAELVEQAANPRVESAVCDLSSGEAIAAFARRFLADHEELHVLVNNAGAWSSRRQLTPEGHELTWATNVLGYHRLTRALEPALRAARQARVVNVASRLARGLDLGDLRFERRPYDGVAAYAQSKQANRMWTRALARRLAGSGATANSVHPGGVDTGLFFKGGGVKGLLGGLYMKLFGRTAEQGADTVVWLAADPAVKGQTGGYYADRQRRRCAFEDEAAEERLWAALEAPG